MTDVQHQSPEADPARHDPAGVRGTICACCGRAPEPDPTDENLRMLRRASQLSLEAMERATTRSQRAMAADPDPNYDAADRADLSLERAGRALRFCIALSEKLHANRLEREKKAAAGDAAETKQRKARHKAQVERLVKEAIEHEAERLTESETESYNETEFDELAEIERQQALHEALAARLEEEDIEQDLGHRPTSELVGRLCDDFRVKPLWQRWGTQHWALEEVRREVPGSPFADLPPAVEPEPAAIVPEEPKLPEPAMAEAQPEEPAVPVWGTKEWFQSAEHKRECEEYQERVRRRFCGPP